MNTKNYYVELARREMEKGESLSTIAEALQNIAEVARIEGAWSVWKTVCEAQMILGI